LLGYDVGTGILLIVLGGVAAGLGCFSKGEVKRRADAKHDKEVNEKMAVLKSQ